MTPEDESGSPESIPGLSDPPSGEAVVEAIKNGVMRGVVKDIRETVAALNKLIAEAAHYGIYSNIEVVHVDTIGALARVTLIRIECSKVIR